MSIGDRRRRNAGIAVLSSGHLLAFADRAKIAGAMPALRIQIAMSDATAGWVLGTSFAFGYGITLLLLLRVPPRVRPQGRLRMASGVALWTIASLSTGLVHSVGSLIVARTAAGCGQAFFIPAALDRIANDAGSGVRPSSLATFVSSAPLGRSVGLALIGGTMLAFAAVPGGRQDGWRWAFVLTAVPNLVLLWFVSDLRSGARTALASGGVCGMLAGRQLLYQLLALTPIVVIQALAGWAPTLFVQAGRVGASTAAIAIGAVSLVGSAGGALVAGYVMQRSPWWQRHIPVVIAGSLLVTMPSLALFCVSGEPTLSLIALLIADVMLALASFAGLLGWQQLRPPHRGEGANDFFMALVTIVGFGIGPWLTGLVAGVSGTLGAALLLCGLGCAAVAAVTAGVLQPRWRDMSAS